MASNQSDYPIQFSVEYPDQPLNRLTTLFRWILILPVYLLGLLVTAYTSVPLVFMLVFRRKYPRWWFDWNLELWRFNARIEVYSLALRDEYPATDDHQAVHLNVDYPDADTDLNRWLPLIKWLLAIPHYVVLTILGILALIAAALGWIMVIITASYPRALFDFLVGVGRYATRVQGYTTLLVTDRYPPFRLDP